MMHQKHINNLLASSSLLDPAPHSPYTRELTLAPFQPTVGLSRRQIARQQNSPFTGPGGSRAGGNDGRVGDTPTKKKKSRVQQLGREDDESSSVGGRKVVKKKKPYVAPLCTNAPRACAQAGLPGARPSYAAEICLLPCCSASGCLQSSSLTYSNPRAPSPTDSVASASFAPNPAYPRTARQLAAAQAAQQKAKRAERDADDSDESEPERIPEGKKRSLNFGPGGSSGLAGQGASSGAQGMQVTQSSDSAMGLGLDMFGGGDPSGSGFAGGLGNGTGQGQGAGSRSVGGTPNLGATQMKKSRTNTGGSVGGASAGGGVGTKRSRDDDDSEDDGTPLARAGGGGGGDGRAGPSGTAVPGAGPNGNGPNGQSKNMRKPSGMPPSGPGHDTGDHDHTDGEAGGEGEGDGKLYCTCRQISYGEMIGCDDDECMYEWVRHFSFGGLDAGWIGCAAVTSAGAGACCQAVGGEMWLSERSGVMSGTGIRYGSRKDDWSDGLDVSSHSTRARAELAF